MHCTVKMTEDLYWVGASDRRLALFESVYPIPRGVSYNAYVLLDEKTVLLDTVDQSVAGQFFENLAHVLGGRPLDYIVVHELCHLFAAGHSADFYALMEKYLPDYKERGRLLSSLPRELV